MLCVRAICGVNALIALIACSGDAPTLSDAATHDADVDRADASTLPPPPVDLCEVGSTIGAGVMSGALEGGRPIMTPTATLDRFSSLVPALLQDMTLPVPNQLQLHTDGMLAVSKAGFFDVGKNGVARFQLVANKGESLTALAGDLDDDGDEDVVAVGVAVQALDEDAGTSAPAAALTLFERVGNGQLRRRAHFQAAFIAGLGSAVVLADHDTDGDSDLLVFDIYGTPFALRNDGDFAFTETALREPSGEFFAVEALSAEDRNGDGAIDLAAVGSALELAMIGMAPTRFEMRVYLNDGAGSFAAPVISVLSNETAPDSYAWGDVTGDGLADLVLLGQQISIAESLDATRLADAVELSVVAHGLTLGDADGDGVLDIAAYSNEGVDVLQVRSGLELESTRFDVPWQGLKAIAIEPASANQPAQLHALYHAGCRPACGADCELSCIFEACAECIAHSDCGEDEACVEGECRAR
jgi:hypothetical protein